MNPFFRAMRPNPMNNLMNVMNQARQIRQNPNMLAQLLKQRGLINDRQMQDIQQMGGNYEQIGRYLMNNGAMPNNVDQYKNTVDQVQNMMNQ